MKVTVFGSSGEATTGSQVVRQALDAGHHVVLIRSRARFVIPEHERLTIVLGDATSRESIDKVLTADTEAVVTAIGANSLYVTDVCSVSTKHIVEAMKTKCPKARLLAVTSLGTGDSVRDFASFYAFMIWFFLWRALVDKNTQEQIIFMQTGWLDWVIARPGGLSKGESKGVYKTEQYSKGGSISRSDVAHFLIRNLKGGEFKHKAIALTY